MVQNSLKESKECFIFETLASQSDFLRTYAIFREYDATHSGGKILPGIRDKIAIRKMFEVFDKAKRSLAKGEAKLDFTDKEVMAKMASAVRKKIYEKCSCPQKGEIAGNVSVSVSKFYIGSLLHYFADNIAYKRGIAVEKSRHIAIAATNRYGHVGFGDLKNSVKIKNMYQTTQQIIRERVAREK